jgi:hypothetical protein
VQIPNISTSSFSSGKVGLTPSRLGPLQGLELISSVSKHELYFYHQLVPLGPQVAYKGLGKRSKPRRLNLVITKIQDFQRPIPLQHLSDIRYPSLLSAHPIPQLL